MDLGPVLFPVAPELGVMSRRAPSLVWERLRAPSLVCERLRVPSLVCERLRAPSRDVTLEPEAVRERIRRVMEAEGTAERGESQLHDGRMLEAPAHQWRLLLDLAEHLRAPSILTAARPCVHSQRWKARSRRGKDGLQSHSGRKPGLAPNPCSAPRLPAV